MMRRSHSDIVFIDIDTQHDFIDVDGALSVPGAAGLVENFRRLTQLAYQEFYLLIGTQDAHTRNDPEFADWPPHCVQGTRGWEKIPETLLEPRLVVPLDPEWTLPDNWDHYPQIVVQKNVVDVSKSRHLRELLALGEFKRAILYGVALDVCVDLALPLLSDLHLEVTLATDATAAIDAARGRDLLAAYEQRGMRLATTSEVLQELSEPIL